MEIIFERATLYKEVWGEPLTRLGKKYGLSDNGLRKICKAMNIPLPTAGHWAKVAAGHQVRKIPLPDAAERTTYTCHPPVTEESNELLQDKQWSREHEAFEDLPENRIVVDLNPRRWHQAIISLRDKYRKAAQEYEGYRKLAEKPRRIPPVWGSSSWEAEWRWKVFLNRGQLLVDTHKAFPVRVSLLTYQRAMAILNALAWESGKRGFKVSVSEKKGRIEFEGHGATVSLRLVERLEDQWKAVESAGKGPPSQEKTKAPTGKLRLFLEGSGSSVHEIADTEGAPLETKLNSVFAKIYRVVVGLRAETRRWEEWRRQRELEELRRQQAEEIRREEVRRAEEERQRRMALENEAANWQTATQIRQYVAHVMASAAEPIPASLRDWGDWALRVATDLDPTEVRCNSANS